jgi:hypothetical protein
MHLEFNLTIEGEPPTEQQSDHLAESIVTAPVCVFRGAYWMTIDSNRYGIS